MFDDVFRESWGQRGTRGGKTNCFCSFYDLLTFGSHKAGRGKGATVFFAPKARKGANKKGGEGGVRRNKKNE